MCGVDLCCGNIQVTGYTFIPNNKVKYKNLLLFYLFKSLLISTCNYLHILVNIYRNTFRLAKCIGTIPHRHLPDITNFIIVTQ